MHHTDKPPSFLARLTGSAEKVCRMLYGPDVPGGTFAPFVTQALRFRVSVWLSLALLLISPLVLVGALGAQTLTITKGGTYTGYNITQPNVSFSEPAVYVDTTEPVTLEYDSIVTAGWGISRQASDRRGTQSKFWIPK
jgi:hypothetical protein